MLKHFLTVAALGLFLGAGAVGQAEAASFAPDFGKQVSDATGGNALTKTNGGWWAVPVVVGGVILLHHIHRHHRHRHYYHRRHRRYR